MSTFLKRFWASAVSLAGVVGLYLGAKAVDLTKAFWLVLLAAAGIAAFLQAAPKIREYATRIRGYPELKELLEKAEARVSSLTALVEATKVDMDSRFVLGLNEGRARIVGSFYSLEYPAPELVAVKLSEKSVILIGRYDVKAPVNGTRYTVITSMTGEVHGAVEVFEADQGRNFVLMRCVEETSPSIWDHLRNRAAYDSSPPVGIGFTRYIHNGTKLLTDESPAIQAPTNEEL